MPEYIIRILKQVEVLQKVDERVITAPSEASARREASYILGEEHAGDVSVVAETEEKKDGKVEEKETKGCPF